MEEKNLIVKSNNLIEGFMEMSRMEYIFILYLTSKIKKDDSNFMIQMITVKEFSELLETSTCNIYEQLQIFEDKLASSFIKIKEGNGDRIKIPWFGYLKYHNNQGILEICFNSKLKSSLLNLDTNFTKYYLKNVKYLNSQYSIRLYELLKQYQNLTYRIIDVDELKLLLGIEHNKYKAYADFKKNVIVKPLKKINENEETDIKVNFEEIKMGRKVEKIKFHIQKKETEKKSKTTTKTNIEHQDLIAKFKEETGAELHTKRVEELIQKKGVDKVNAYIDNFKKYRPTGINDIASFFYKAVLEEYPLQKKSTGSNIPQHHNFEQRKYDPAYLRSLYEEV